MFKHELGQVVQVTISGEEEGMKPVLNISNGPNQYLIHYLAADGRGTDGWFEEGELSCALPHNNSITKPASHRVGF